MLIATGVMLVKLRRYEDAEKCFKKAFQIGDVEGNALTELGSLYEHMKRYDQAARAYEYFLKLYCDETKDVAVCF
uniref:TPR_REGION domain-containing protein n=1 Tax=Bursaphelenchus xylophilus TaxID=6326 RepID=A0A1I7SNQ8_BURXY